LVLDNFDEFSGDDIDDTNIHGRTILDQGNKFLSLTRDSIDACKQMATYATDFMEYVQILMEEDVLVTDFIETMKLQAQAATSNRMAAARLVNGYCNILINLQSIVNEIEDFTCQTGIEKELENDASQARKEQKARTFAAVGTGITTGAAIIAAPFTGGLSLAIIGALGITSASAMIGTSVTSVRYGELAKFSESELSQINQIRINIGNVIKGLKFVVHRFNALDEFFKKEEIDVNKVMETYGIEENNASLRISRMKGTAIRKQWTRVKEVLETYSTEAKLLMESVI
ncbi:6250_t:CDS:2, partial [Acaulospora morrowiae]